MKKRGFRKKKADRKLSGAAVGRNDADEFGSFIWNLRTAEEDSFSP